MKVTEAPRWASAPVPDPVLRTWRAVHGGDLRPIVYALALATFALLPWQGLRIGVSVTYADVTLVAAALVACVSLHRRYPAEQWPGRLLVAGLVFMLVGGAVALGFSDVPRESALLLLRVAGVAGVCFVLLR